MAGPIRHDVRSVEVIRVIRVRNLRGAGVVDDPVRLVTTYWLMDGNRLLEIDELADA